MTPGRVVSTKFEYHILLFLILFPSSPLSLPLLVLLLKLLRFLQLLRSFSFTYCPHAAMLPTQPIALSLSLPLAIVYSQTHTYICMQPQLRPFIPSLPGVQWAGALCSGCSLRIHVTCVRPHGSEDGRVPTNGVRDLVNCTRTQGVPKAIGKGSRGFIHLFRNQKKTDCFLGNTSYSKFHRIFFFYPPDK